MVNPPLWSKILTTVLLSIVASIFYLLNRKSKPRFLCMIAMILCTVGDVFMTNALKINEMLSTVIGALAFMGGHLVYSKMFYYLLKKEKGSLNSIGFYIGLAVGILPLIVLEIFGIFFVEEPETLFLVAVPVYVLVITLHIATNYAYSFKISSLRSLILIFAVTLFYVTDIWIFINMFNIIPNKQAALDLEHCVWHFYPLAQLLLIVFSSNLMKEN